MADAEWHSEFWLRPTTAFYDMKPSESLYINIRNIRYHVRSWGCPDSPRLFLLHGWMDCSASFQFYVDALERNWHVLAPDWRGYGDSEWQPGDTYRFADLLADLHCLMVLLQPEYPVNLLGHSMGANVASLYAGIVPDRVRRLVNVEGYGMREQNKDEESRRYARWLRRVGQPQRSPSYASFEELAERLRESNPLLTLNRARFLSVHHARLSETGRVVLRCDPRHRDMFKNPGSYPLSESMACWQAVSAPTLWIASDDGTHKSRLQSLGREAISARKACFPNLREAFIAETGHQIHLERPEWLAGVTERFLL